MSTEKLTDLKKVRGILRSSLTKLITKIENKLNEQLIDVNELEEDLEQLNDKSENLKLSDSEIQRLLKSEELEKEIETVEEYREKIVTWKYRIKKRIKKSNEEPEGVLKNVKIQEDNKTSTIAARLPKIDLPTFEGDITKFFSFWQIFDVNINQRKDLSTIEKLSYLLSLLRGEPAKLVSGFAVTAENYTDVIKVLQDQYSQKSRIVDLNVNKILEMKPVASASQVSELKSLITELSINLRNLNNLGISTNDCSPILNTKIKQLIPSELLLLFERQKGNEEETKTEDLVAFLQKEINHRENVKPILDPKAPIFRPRNYTTQWRLPFRRTPTFPTRARLPQPRMWTPQYLPHQPVANRPHNHRELNPIQGNHRPAVFPPNKSNVICFCCGQAGHVARECQSR